jgi:DNA polymerase-3 subunit beta
MKVVFLSSYLSTKLSFLNHAVSQRGQLPILTNLLLEAKKGKFYLYATDLEIGIQTNISANVEEEGRITTPAKNFSELIANLPEEKINLYLDGQNLKISTPKVKAVFQTTPADEFPKLYEEKGEEMAQIPKNDFEKKLGRVVFAASIDTSRPNLSGVLLRRKKREYLAVATDGYRLSLQKNILTGGKEDDEKQDLLIPARLLRETILLREEERILKMFILGKNNQVIFTQGETSVVGRLIEAQYPDYEKIIPQKSETKAVFQKEDLQNAVKICSVFAKETANVVKLSLKKEKIIVSANSPSVGENTVDVEAKIEGEENEIAFNARYLAELLANIDEEEMVFEMQGPFNPGVFKIAGDNSFLHLIMPIRVQG